MPTRSTKPPRCQHKSSVTCALCRRERNELQQVGAWAREEASKPSSTRSESNDYASFVQDNALRTTTAGTATSHAQPKSKSSNPTTHQQPQLRPHKHHPAFSTSSSDMRTPSHLAASPSSTVAATRANSLVVQRPASTSARTVPVFNASASQVASAALAAAAARGNVVRAAPPQPGLAGSVQGGGEEESEEESEESSEDESESDSDDDEWCFLTESKKRRFLFMRKVPCLVLPCCRCRQDHCAAGRTQ